MNIKRFFAAFLAVLLLLSPMSALAGDGAPEFLISVEADRPGYAVGDQIRVACWLDRIDSRDQYYLYNFQEFFVFNSEALQYVAATPASGFAISGEQNYGFGSEAHLHAIPIRYQYTNTGAPPLRSASFRVAILTFKVLQDVDLHFYFDNTQVWVDPDGGIQTETEGSNGSSDLGELPATDSYTLEYSSDPGGTATAYGMAYGAGIPSGDVLPAYTHVRLAAVPDPYSAFTGWTDENGAPVGTENPFEFYIDSDLNLTATFARTHCPVKFGADGGGTVNGTETPSGGGSPTPITSGDYQPIGSVITLDAVPNDGYEFVGWSDGGTEPHREIPLTDDTDDVDLTAEFERNAFRVVYAAGTGGRVSGEVTLPGAASSAPLVSGTTYPKGSEIILKAVPNSGYSFSKWNDVKNEPDIRSFTLTDDVNATASFASNSVPYTPYTPSTPSTSDTVPLTGNKGTAPIDAEKNGKDVKIDPITDSDLKKAGTDGTPSLDVTDFAPNAESVTIPAKSIDKIGDSPADGLEVVLPDGTITPDNKALDKIADKAGSKPVTLYLNELPKEEEKIKANPENDELLHNPKVYDAYLVCDGKKLDDFGDGEVLVGVPYDSDGDIRVFAVDDDGNTRVIPDFQEDSYTYFPLQPETRYIIADLATSQAKCPQDERCVYAHFPDADPQAWYHGGVHYCVENGLMIGYDDGKFYPYNSLTRAQLVMVIWRIEGQPNTFNLSTFSDVPDYEWFYDAVKWAAANGIVNGYGDGRFGPNDPITREQLATIFFRYAKMRGYNTEGRVDLSKYSDSALISPYAEEALSWANFAQVINQRGSGFMAPTETAMRCEAAFMIQQYKETVCVKAH